jgi:hypothetical protein
MNLFKENNLQCDFLKRKTLESLSTCVTEKDKQNFIFTGIDSKRNSGRVQAGLEMEFRA